MGVKSCFRKGCDKIMCDRYSNLHGYICNECFDELHDKVKAGEEVNVADFMDSYKGKAGVVKNVDDLEDIFKWE